MNDTVEKPRKREGLNIQLPDFTNTSETEVFMATLHDNIDKYGVKTLLECSTFIVNHMRRIEYHKKQAEKIIVRVNGDITAVQKTSYTRRAIRSLARNFYGKMSDKSLDAALRKEGYTGRGGKEDQLHCLSRDERIKLLVDLHVKAELESRV